MEISKYKKHNNSYSYKPKDHWEDRIEVEIGDVKRPDKFLPQVKLMRWDNEVNFSVRLLDNFDNSQIKENAESIEWLSNKREAKFYDLPESEELPEGGYEFEVILKEKPLSNIITLSLQTKGLEFFYQPKLTQKEIDNGFIRPENVIESYAVYYKNCPRNYVGGKKYKFGKAFHIYRPRIIDSAGKEVWGKLNIDLENGLMTIEIPQEFLDTAVYPIRHATGLTFGYDTIGTGYVTTANQIKGNVFTGFAGIGVSMSVYLYITNNQASARVELAIYEDSDDGLVADGVTDEQSGLVSGTQLVTQDFLSPPTFSAIDYKICKNVNYPGEFVYSRYDTAGSSGFQKMHTQGTWPDPLSPDSTGDSELYSVYVTYSAGPTTQTLTAKASIAKEIVIQVGANNDDGYQVIGGAQTLNSDIYVGVNPDQVTTWNGGVRFQNVPIPNGSVILSAILSGYKIGSGGNEASSICRVKVRGEINANPGDFTGDTINSRTRSDAGIDWDERVDIGSDWHSTDEIKTTIQEILDRTLFASGNAMVLLLDNDNTDTSGSEYAYLRWKDYETTAAEAIKVTILYQPLNGQTVQKISAKGNIRKTIVIGDSANIDTAINHDFADVMEDYLTGNMYLGELSIIGSYSTFKLHIGLRFALNIPKDSPIISARIKFYASSGQVCDGINTIIHAVDSDNTSNWTGVGYELTNAPLISASEPWSTSGSFSAYEEIYTSYLTDLVQAIVNRSGWSLGNGISFIIKDNSSIDFLSFNDFGTEPIYAAVLEITYIANGLAAKAEIIVSSFQQHTQTITSLASIQKSNLQTLTTKGRIGISQTQTIDAKGYVKKTMLSSLTALGRVQQSFQQTANAKALIKVKQTQVVTAKSRIAKLFSQTITALGRISITSTQTIEAKGKITATQTQIVEAKGRIGINSQQTITTKGNIKQTQSLGKLAYFWNVQYEASAFPEDSIPAWTKYLYNDPVITITDGVLKLDFPILNDGVWYEILDGDLSDSVGYTVESRMKVDMDLDTGHVFLDIFDGVSGASLKIYNDKVTLLYGGFGDDIEEYEIDATEYHVYRITVKDSKATLYIDGVSKIIMENPGENEYQAVAFGISTGAGDSYWDYVYYSALGAFAPGLFAKGRIQISSIQTISALGRIGILGGQTIDAKGNIYGTTEQTVNARGDIKKTQVQGPCYLLAEDGSRILQENGASILICEGGLLAKGYITTTQSQTVEAKGLIKGLSSQSITAKGNIDSVTRQIIDAKGCIATAGVEQTIQSKANILKSTSRTIFAKGAIATYKVVEIIDRVRSQDLIEEITYVKSKTSSIAYNKIDVVNIVDERVRVEGVQSSRVQVINITNLSRVVRTKWLTTKARIRH